MLRLGRDSFAVAAVKLAVKQHCCFHVSALEYLVCIFRNVDRRVR